MPASLPPHVAALLNRRLTFFHPAPPGALWRFFLPCLLAAFLLRAGVGLSGEWTLRVDEVYQYLEQAHRLVFGYGQVPWEYRLGARTWLLPMMSAWVLWLCKILDFAHPDYYIPAVKLWHAALSLTIPAGMYLFGRRTLGESAARLALLFGCFWHEFIIYASHALAEHYATTAFFLTLCLLTPTAGRGRLFTAGVLLGLTVIFRSHYLPAVGVFGLTLLAAYSPRRWSIGAGGVLSALLLWGITDLLTWGRWWHSQRLYLDLFLFNDIFAHLDIYPKGGQFEELHRLAEVSYGLYAVALFSVFCWRRNWFVWAPTAAVFLAHLMSIGGKYTLGVEYSHLFILSPLLWLLIASLADVLRAGNADWWWRKAAAQSIVLASLLANVAVFAGGIPHPEKHYHHKLNAMTDASYGFFRSMTNLHFARVLASRPAAEMRAVFWDIGGGLFTIGGYYYLHHRVPILLPTGLEEHNALLQEHPDLRTVVSHIVTDRYLRPPGFTPILLDKNYALLVNDDLEQIQTLRPFITDVYASSWNSLPEAAEKLGIYFPSLHESLLSEDFVIIPPAE